MVLCKVISYVPSENGRLYEIRSNGVGTFIAQTRKATAFQKVRAGFIPALPKIPFSVLSEILAFFKSYITKDGITEALAYIFWSKAEERYFVHIPKQEVSKDSVDTTEMPLADERFTLVMEIHSHNTMPAYFSGDFYPHYRCRRYRWICHSAFVSYRLCNEKEIQSGNCRR